DLPATQSAADIENFPSRASENFFHRSAAHLDHNAVTKAALTCTRCRGKTRNQFRLAPEGVMRETVGAPVGKTDVVAAIHRQVDFSESLLLYRAQKIVRIFVAVQSARRNGCR